MKKIGIYTWHNVSSAYACLLYLKHELERKTSEDVDLWSFTDPDSLQDCGNKDSYHSYSNSWYGKIPRFRVYVAKFLFFIDAIKKDIIIINDLDFFLPAYIIKRIKPSKKIVHYNTEICGFEIPCFKYILRFYKKHADFPDVIIECLNERAIYRKNHFGIEKKIFTIDNTLPVNDLIRGEVDFETRNNVTSLFQHELPIVIYAGGATLSRQLNEIIDCVNDLDKVANFLFFCYGSNSDYDKLIKYVNENCKTNNISINRAVPRKQLFKIMNVCDIGINYYRPDTNINFKYASPSKFFEYMACGLNIVSTNNVGINKIIKENDIGVCIEENETIGNGVKRLIVKGLKDKEGIKRLFRDKYSYEVEADKVIDLIIQ